MVKPLKRALDFGQDRLLELPDSRLVALVKGPLFDSLSTNQSRLGKNFKMFTRGRLADLKLLRDEHTAHAILDQVSIHLRWKMTSGVLEPFQDQPAAAAGQRPQCKIRSHIDN